MAKNKLEDRIAVLAGLSPDAAHAALPKALADKNNYYVAKAAALSARHGFREYLPLLEDAYARFFLDPTTTDPQCWAKHALATAFKDLEHNRAEVFLRGLRHQQWEPVWGGRADTAARLRSTCLLALPNTDLPAIQVLQHLAQALADHDKSVRADVPLALAQLNSILGTPLLRYKALTGDPDPEVTGNVLRALLSIEGKDGLPFVQQVLEGDHLDNSLEAALALAESAVPGAFALLQSHWLERQMPDSHRFAIATALGASPDPLSYPFLERIAAKAPPRIAEAARGSLQVSRFR